MKRLIFGGIAFAVAFPLSASAAGSLFDGTWKADESSMRMTKALVLVVANGMYDCQFCVPELKVKADGRDYRVTGHPYYDTAAIKIVDAHTVQVSEKKGGNVVFAATETVSADGRTYTDDYTDRTASSGVPVTGKFVLIRLGEATRGAHLLSGSWRVASSSASENSLLVSYKLTGDMLSMSTPTGQSYSAKTDGSDAPYSGDFGTTSVSVTMSGKRTLVETDKRNGQVIGVMRATVSADGKTMKVSYDDKLHGSTTTYRATRYKGD